MAEEQDLTATAVGISWAIQDLVEEIVTARNADNANNFYAINRIGQARTALASEICKIWSR
jgi:hypothetical protein